MQQNTWNIRLFENIVFRVTAEINDDGVIIHSVNGEETYLLYNPTVKRYLNSERFAEDLEYYFESEFLMNQELELHPDGKGDFFLAI